MTKKPAHLIVAISLLFGAMILLYQSYGRFGNRGALYHESNLPPKSFSLSRRSKWDDDKLVVVPAIWKEIDWANRSSWPQWLLEGLNPQSSYHVHLYQRVDPNSNAPYDWPYCANRHEEAGVYLQFIYEYYYDLPKTMLFIHGDPSAHSPLPIQIAQCIRKDVHYASINPGYFTNRHWNMWIHIENETVGYMYPCAIYLLSLFGFDGETQLNPKNITPRGNSTITAPCCAQFFVTRERIRHYTYEQWSAVFGANLRSYCATPDDAEITGERDDKWFGGSLEHIWHIVLGFHPNNMQLPRAKTISDPCHLLRPSCQGLPC